MLLQQKTVTRFMHQQFLPFSLALVDSVWLKITKFNSCAQNFRYHLMNFRVNDSFFLVNHRKKVKEQII